jgi:RPA family protein
MGEREPGNLTPEGAADEPGLELPPAAQWVVDDIEAGIARLEDPAGSFFEVAAGWLPGETAAGDVLLVTSIRTVQGSVVTFQRDETEAERRLDEAGKTLERLRQRDPGGNVSL